MIYKKLTCVLVRFAKGCSNGGIYAKHKILRTLKKSNWNGPIVFTRVNRFRSFFNGRKTRFRARRYTVGLFNYRGNVTPTFTVETTLMINRHYAINNGVDYAFGYGLNETNRPTFYENRFADVLVFRFPRTRVFW